MHTGIVSNFANPNNLPDTVAFRSEVELCVLAEELGFDSVWLPEHHFTNYAMCPDPLLILSHVAGRTRRIRLGTQVVIAPWHDPVRLAEQILLLDHLSEGRALLGFGRGMARTEYLGLRVDQERSQAIFEEVVGLVLPAIEHGYIEGGETFHQRLRPLRPGPFKSFAGRVFTGGGTMASMSIAARLGLGRLLFLSVAAPDPEPAAASPAYGRNADEAAAQELWQKIWRECHPERPPPAPIVTLLVFVDASSERAQVLAQECVSASYRAAARHYASDDESYRRIESARDHLEESTASSAHIDGTIRNSLVGTPRDILEKLDGFRRDYAPQAVTLHIYSGGMTAQDAANRLRLFAAGCLPELKSWTAPKPSFD